MKSFLLVLVFFAATSFGVANAYTTCFPSEEEDAQVKENLAAGNLEEAVAYYVALRDCYIDLSNAAIDEATFVEARKERGQSTTPEDIESAQRGKEGLNVLFRDRAIAASDVLISLALFAGVTFEKELEYVQIRKGLVKRNNIFYRRIDSIKTKVNPDMGKSIEKGEVQ